MGHRQSGKGKKRRKSWHRGRSEMERFFRSPLPDVGSGADPTSGAPVKLRRTGKTTGSNNRGPSL